ncbi:hypothetical protein P7K49_031262 [Saguinus oedipus]|uniref:Uncharacterized protein n=1 Tax=Saguinus oedipus TaxID=9490 RepID=A0ABQ9TZL1_SAGOE|nr:hypothetical protein P7K49_031262 [Saguinus oedipus]
MRKVSWEGDTGSEAPRVLATALSSWLTLEGGCWPHTSLLKATGSPGLVAPSGLSFFAYADEKRGNSTACPHPPPRGARGINTVTCVKSLELGLTESVLTTTGPGTGSPETATTADATEVPATTPGAGTSSEGALQTPGLAETAAPGHAASESRTPGPETSSGTSVPAGPIPVAETRGTQTISPATETRIVTKIAPPDFAVVTTSVETSVASSSPEGAGTTTLEAGTGTDPEDTVSDTLCTDDSSEEARTLTVAPLPLAHSSTEAEGLSAGSSASSHGSRPVITASWTPASDVTVLTEALLTVTHMEVINCSITEIETATSIIPGASATDHIPTAAVDSPTSHLPALPDSTATEPHVAEATASAETLSTAGATESATPDAAVRTLLPTNSATEGEVTAPRALMTAGGNPLEEPSALSAETPAYVTVSGAASVSTEAGSAVDKTTSFAGASASAYSPSEAATTQNFTPSETAMDFTARGPLPTSRDPLPSVHPTTASRSPGTNSTSAKTPMEPLTATSPTARTGQTTNIGTGENGGFLLLRLSVASLEDLTDPRVAERLMQQHPTTRKFDFSRNSPLRLCVNSELVKLHSNDEDSMRWNSSARRPHLKLLPQPVPPSSFVRGLATELYKSVNGRKSAGMPRSFMSGKYTIFWSQ